MPDGVLPDLADALEVEGLPETTRATLTTVRAYLERHREHSDSTKEKERGLPLGSGMVESACTWLIQQRFKGIVMRWREDGFNALLPLRLAWVNGRFEALFGLFLSPNPYGTSRRVAAMLRPRPSAPGGPRNAMRPAIVALGEDASRIPASTPHKQPFPQRAIRSRPPPLRLGGIEALNLRRDASHDLGVPLSRLRHGIALERHPDSAIVLLNRTDDGLLGLNIRDGFPGGGVPHWHLLCASALAPCPYLGRWWPGPAPDTVQCNHRVVFSLSVAERSFSLLDRV